MPGVAIGFNVDFRFGALDSEVEGVIIALELNPPLAIGRYFMTLELNPQPVFKRAAMAMSPTMMKAAVPESATFSSWTGIKIPGQHQDFGMMGSTMYEA